MGLITEILQKTAPKKVRPGTYTMNPKLLKSRSDIAAFNEIVEIEAKKKAGKLITKNEAKRYKNAIRKLENRGLMTPQSDDERARYEVELLERAEQAGQELDRARKDLAVVAERHAGEMEMASNHALGIINKLRGERNAAQNPKCNCGRDFMIRKVCNICDRDE